MARWKLLTAHYLNVPGTTWEYSEVDRSTGKQKRTQFMVPQLLNPEDPADWNYKTYGLNGQIADGEVVVAYEGRGEPKDITFIGDPTPDMRPLDAEAEAISASFATKWKRPVEQAEGDNRGYAERMIEGFQRELENVRQTQPTTKVEGISELLAAITGMMKQNQEMMMLMMANQQGLKAIVDQESPLPEVEVTEEDMAESAAVTGRRRR